MSMKTKILPLSELKKIAAEYNQFPKEFHKIKINGMVVIMKHGNLTAVLSGFDVITRGYIVTLVGKSLIVLKVSSPMREGHIFLGIPGLTEVANAYVHKYLDGHVYIGSMSSHLQGGEMNMKKIKPVKHTYMIAVSTTIQYPVTAYMELVATSAADANRQANATFKKRIPDGWIKALEQEAINSAKDEIQVNPKAQVRLINCGRATMYHSKAECQLCSRIYKNK